MTGTSPITTLFLDIGGVLLTNGWDRGMLRRSAETFGLDLEEINQRHHLTFDTYEVGKLSLDEYLRRVIFYRPRSFSRSDFQEFMFSQSQPFPNMMEMVRDLKARHGLHVAVISNEGRELAEYRIRKFNLRNFIDFFVVSSFVHFRKPDAGIYHTALDIAQVTPEETLYIEDRKMFVEVAAGLGIPAIHHTSYEKTREELEARGLALAIAEELQTADWS